MTQELSSKIKTLSFVSIIVVVFIHAFNFPLHDDKIVSQPLAYKLSFFIEFFISYGLGHFAVPLFFALSGYLFFISYDNTIISYKNKIKKRFYTLLVPYTLWFMITMLVYWVLQLIPGSHKYFQNFSVSNSSFLDILKIYITEPRPHQLWFIRDLFVIQLFCPIIYLLIRYLDFSLLFLLLILWIENEHVYIISSMGIFFFMLGSYLAINKINIEYKIDNPRCLLLIWIIIVFWDCLGAVNNEHLNHGDYFRRIIGVLAIWFNFDLIDKLFMRLNLSRLTSYSFIIYLAHEPYQAILKKIGTSFLGPSLILYMLTPVIVIMLIIRLASLTSKKLPAIYRILVGGR